MTNNDINTMQAIAAIPDPTILIGLVNNCKSIIYKTIKALKGRFDVNHGCNPCDRRTQANHRHIPCATRTFLLAFLLALLAPAAAWAQSFGGGSGIETDPYIISTTNYFNQLPPM